MDTAPQPRHEEQPRDHRVEPAALQGDVAGLDAVAAATRPVAGGEDRGQVRRHEGARLATAAADGGPSVAGEHPGGALAGRALLAGEAGPEARRASSSARPASQASRRRRAPEYARRVFGLMEAAATRRAVAGGRHGMGRGWKIHLHHRRLDPRVAGRRDPVLEAVDAELERAVRRDPDDEGVDQPAAAIGGRLLRHAPNQSVPLGSRMDSRGGRVRGPPGRSPAPACDGDRELAGGHGRQALLKRVAGGQVRPPLLPQRTGPSLFAPDLPRHVGPITTIPETLDRAGCRPEWGKKRKTSRA